MKLMEVNNSLSHKIIGGSEYCWKSFGNTARYLDYETEYAYASVVFDSRTQDIYAAEINDKADKHSPYRWLNPNYKQKYYNEAKERNVDPNEAYDNIKWVDLETEEDWLTKANAIANGKEFDTRVEVTLELDDELMFELMMAAHTRDITLNKMVEHILKEVIATHKGNI